MRYMKYNKRRKGSSILLNQQDIKYCVTIFVLFTQKYSRSKQANYAREYIKLICLGRTLHTVGTKKMQRKLCIVMDIYI